MANVRDDVTYNSPYGQRPNDAIFAPFPEGSPWPVIPNTPAGGDDGPTTTTTTTTTPTSRPTSRPRGNPYLDRLKGRKDADMARRRASNLEKKKQTLLRWGSKELASKILGADDPILGLISDDPNSSTSAMALINRNYQNKEREALSALNQLNLWFSSGHGETQNEIGRQKLGEIDQGVQAIQSDFFNMDEQLAAAEASWADQLFNAELQGFEDGGTGFAGAPGGWESGYGGNQPQGGYTEDQVLSAAGAYAAPRGYTPKNITHEGQIFYQNGQPGINVKFYDSNGGTTTEWVPL